MSIEDHPAQSQTTETVWQTLQRIRLGNGCDAPCVDAGNCHCNHMLDLTLDRDTEDEDA